MARLTCLNLGCGNDYRRSTDQVDWVNVDQGNCVADFRFDLEDIPSWHILGDNQFDRVEAIQVFEHIHKESLPFVVREVYRVLKHGGILYVAVPHGFSDNFITDPTHQTPFSTRTFDYFIDDAPEAQGLRANGIIYGWGDIHFAHTQLPQLDGNHSIHFNLRAIKK